MENKFKFGTNVPSIGLKIHEIAFEMLIILKKENNSFKKCNFKKYNINHDGTL